MKKLAAILGSALLVAACALGVGYTQSGGFPSFPYFLGVGIGTAAPSTGGLVVAAPSASNPAISANSYSGGASGLDIVSTLGQSSYERFYVGSTTQSYLGVAGQTGGLSNDASVNDVVLRSKNGARRFTVNTGASTQLAVSSTGDVSIATPSSGAALTVNGATGSTAEVINGTANNAALAVTAPSTTNQSAGIYIEAGTTSTDYALYAANYANNIQFFGVRGDGGVVVGTPTGSDEGLGSVNAVSYYQNGVKLPIFSYGYINQSAASTCTVTLSSGISGVSCTSIGFVTVTFSNTYSVGNICSFTPHLNTSSTALYTISSSTTGGINEYASSSPSNVIGYLVCMGT